MPHFMAVGRQMPERNRMKLLTALDKMKIRRNLASEWVSKENNKEQQIVALREAALQYHEFPTPGKIEIAPTK